MFYFKPATEEQEFEGDVVVSFQAFEAVGWGVGTNIAAVNHTEG